MSLFTNLWLYLTIFINILKKSRDITIFENMRQNWAVIDKVEQYSVILDNIWQYWIIIYNIWLYRTIFGNIYPYKTMTNSLTSHVTILSWSCNFETTDKQTHTQTNIHFLTCRSSANFVGQKFLQHVLALEISNGWKYPGTSFVGKPAPIHWGPLIPKRAKFVMGDCKKYCIIWF